MNILQGIDMLFQKLLEICHLFIQYNRFQLKVCYLSSTSRFQVLTVNFFNK